MDVNRDRTDSPLRLSVLDQSPVPEGFSPGHALQNSIALARLVDRLGYTRYWLSEHHAMDTLASSAPEVLLARIGAETQRIRIGSGGIMLPHYSAYKVAEVFRTLHALYPGRIDLGIGRAPGGGPIEALALKRDRTTKMLDDFPDQVAELLAWLDPAGDHTFPASHPFATLRVAPDMPGSPDLWMLGSSLWSSAAAAEFGLPYAFAHFFFGMGTRQAIEAYQRDFVPSARRTRPEATAAVGVICADTNEEAEYLASSVRLLQRRIRMNDRRPVAPPEAALRELAAIGGPTPEEGEWPRSFIGTPAQVRAALESMASALNISELIVNTIVWDQAQRLRSYQLLAAEFKLASSGPASPELGSLNLVSPEPTASIPSAPTLAHR
jgi:luciferase family oxidoreductase group 1